MSTDLSGSAEAVAWICLALGAALLLAGVVIGLALSFKKAPTDVEKKVEEAKSKVDALKDTAKTGALAATSDEQSAATAEGQAEAAKSTLEEISGIIASLPENLRFAGLLVLVGTVLISVATVQFGGHSLF